MSELERFTMADLAEREHRKLINTTIERCAKVAETFLQDGEDVPYGICEKIAVEIRALKS